jgi:hypothetical protein
LVLEENKELNESLILEDRKTFELQKSLIEEKSRLNKRIIVSETEKVYLQNQVDMYMSANEEIAQKYNNLSIEFQKKVDLQDHLNQVGDLKRCVPS